MGNYCHRCDFCCGGSGLVDGGGGAVVVFVVIVGVLALVMGFREVMLTSPPELVHCGGGGHYGPYISLTLCLNRKLTFIR